MDYIEVTFAASQEESMEIKNKFFSYTLLPLLLVGCANIAKRPVACQEAMRDASFYGWMYWLIGTTIQQGECAIIGPMKFESGQYYYYHKQDIDFEVATEKATRGKETPTIDGFGGTLNCKEKILNQFAKTLTANKDAVFGEKYDKSSREVTINTIRMIKESPELKYECTP